MAERVWPSALDVGASGGIPGKIGSEHLLRTWMFYKGMSYRDRFIALSGDFLVTNGGGLVANVAAGSVIIDGYWPFSNATKNVTMANNVVSLLYLQVARDVNGNATALTYGQNTSMVVPADAMSMAEITTAAGAITNIVDTREVAPRPTLATYTGNSLGTGTQDIVLGFTSSVVIIVPRTITWYSISGLGKGSGQKGIVIKTTAITLPTIQEERAEIITRGFRVKGVAAGGNSLNLNGVVYDYLAIP